jgi:MoaA/NifB/PqqE/SkfB family radical SAM enzyme
MDLQENITATKRKVGVSNSYAYDSHWLEFALTTYCQAKCRSCARTNQDTGEKESWLELKHMDLNVFASTLELSKNLNISTIQFCGEFGDPMMHPQINKFVDVSMKVAKDSVIINTNGGLRTPDWYTSIVKQYGDKINIQWAIDGTTHDVNWKYREGVDFERAMNNMKAYIEADGIGIWWFIIFEWNWHQIPQARKIADELGIDIEFKFNQRNHGLISNKSKLKAQRLLNEQV